MRVRVLFEDDGEMPISKFIASAYDEGVINFSNGNTALLDMLIDEVGCVGVNSTYPIVIVTPTTWEGMLERRKDSIIIFDGLNAIETNEFAELCKQYCVSNNLYLILITRECFGGRKKLCRLSYNTLSISEMVTEPDGITHKLVEIQSKERKC